MIQIVTEGENRTVTCNGEPLDILEELLFGVKQFLSSIAKQSLQAALTTKHVIIEEINNMDIQNTENE